MEGNLLKEISYLTRLIEQHKKGNDNSFGKKDDRKLNYPNISAYGIIERQNRAEEFLPPGRVHLNPNFKPKVPGIHVNPRIGKKPMVHVNPKMMKNFSTKNCDDKLLADLNISEYKKNGYQGGMLQRKIEPSVHVNPRLIKELSSVKEKPKDSKNAEKQTKDSKTSVDRSTLLQSKIKIVKNNTSPNQTAKKISNSNLVSLSRRKLVRIRRSSKNGSLVSPTNLVRARRLSNSNMRNTKLSTKYKLVMERVDGTDTVHRSFIKSRQGGLSKYKIDRTHIQRVKKRLSIGNSNNQLNTVNNNNKASGSSTGLVRIGGILYKSSRNQLIRSSNDQQPSKRKRCIINVKGDRFVMASNGKKLRRLNSAGNGTGSNKSSSLVSRVDIGGMTFVEKTPNVLVRAHTRNNISTKAKQRSIQILRNKMRKNNQPCLIFQKFGYCTGQVKGTCPKLHDKKQVALCRNFLQGKCLLDNCPMSHSVCPEKMPTCKYFLEGCCIRDQCPYLHVKVSSNTPICAQFLRGYCAEANKCKQRHVYLCPEFARSEKCAKGKYCPYPHKAISSDYKKWRKLRERRKIVANKKRINKSEVVDATSSLSSSHSEDRKRYYDEAGGSKEEFDKKRRTVLGAIEIMKSVKLAEIYGDDKESKNINDDNDTKVVVQSFEKNGKSDEEDSCPKRTPLGTLPAYIPID